MAIQMGKALAFTAVGGLVAGLAGCGGEQKTTETPAGGTTDATTDANAAPAAAKECCKGKNVCKAQGGCKTEGEGAHECAGKNECKGQGGCKSGKCE